MSKKSPTKTPEEGEFLFKSIIIGDAGVGKSCILLRFTKEEFKGDYNVTIGVDFANKTIKLDQDTTVKLQIWDTAGQEAFGSIIKKFFRNASIVFLVYDVNSRTSFDSLYNWIANAKSNCDEKAVYVLMGNQADRPSEKRQVTFEEGQAFMENNGISFFFETSAKNGDNIDKAFNEATKLAFLQYIKDAIAKSPRKGGNIKISSFNDGPEDAPPQKNGCC